MRHPSLSPTLTSQFHLCGHFLHVFSLSISSGRPAHMKHSGLSFLLAPKLSFGFSIICIHNVLHAVANSKPCFIVPLSAWVEGGWACDGDTKGRWERVRLEYCCREATIIAFLVLIFIYLFFRRGLAGLMFSVLWLFATDTQTLHALCKLVLALFYISQIAPHPR